ncbi:hypothetical protein N6H05_17395 [Sphingobium sp. WTD-1]|uniref:glycine-rich domain-containing protein n=1 Tax=Sphingobium sp. WTD-1 TaxID=2979467 RepID=UPI0024DE749E|nr:hypothetical protein [Sphingobium sp. WTD-1]WIA54817.1 hypothetical protein N6H05_17395 [Sphingobium sp. WTD-1]
MQGVIRLYGPPKDHVIWAALSGYEIGPPDAAFSFTARLARENGWAVAYAARVVEEYKRFCFLVVTGTDQQTPSDAVDQAWHLHLTYTRDYWERFCPQILGRPLHHEPTKGGPVEQGRFFNQYARTLRRYEQVFGVSPPADIWPGAAQRLLDDPRARRVHPRDALILSRSVLRPAFWLAVLLALFLILLWTGKAFHHAPWPF